jgi:hypothetical protein
MGEAMAGIKALGAVASIGDHEGNAGKRALLLKDVQGPADVEAGFRAHHVSDHPVAEGARISVVAQFHGAEILVRVLSPAPTK